MTFLGIDLGTSGLRALLVEADGTPIASAERALSVSRPHAGWSEQDPADWLYALDEAIDELRATTPAFAALAGIGVAGHMHGATLLDAGGQVLRPCILWDDARAKAEAARLDALPAFRDLTGNIVFPGFTAPKLNWVRDHEPEVFAQVAKVLLPAAYLGFHLTGDAVADMSDSAGTSWLDVGRRDWSPALLAACDLTPEQMPRLVEGSAAAGQLRPEIAQRWGVSPTVVVAGGAGDNAAAACGIGALGEGEGLVSLGTSGVFLMARDGYHPAAETALHTFCHTVPERWYQMGVMLAATQCLTWLSTLTGQSPATLSDALGDDLLPPGETRFFPYLSGERTPHNDADIRGAFAGLSMSCNQNALTRAVMEGVAFGLRDSAEALAATGAEAKRLYLVGGGGASRYWARLLATVLNTPLLRPRGGEFGAALGAARLGICAATGADVTSVMRPPEDVETIVPASHLVGAFSEAYEQFRASYPQLKALQGAAVSNHGDP